MRQTRISAHGGKKDRDEDIDVTVSAGQVLISAVGVDDLLDEIDGLLENNADEFIRAYVQKGGE